MQQQRTSMLSYRLDVPLCPDEMGAAQSRSAQRRQERPHECRRSCLRPACPPHCNKMTLTARSHRVLQKSAQNDLVSSTEDFSNRHQRPINRLTINNEGGSETDDRSVCLFAEDAPLLQGLTEPACATSRGLEFDSNEQPLPSHFFDSR